MEETTSATVNSYTYDIANRLTGVDGVAYSWDDNGNMLSDGVYIYTYDNANRLKTVTAAGLNASYTYNGLGDRVSQTVNGATTYYALDLAAGLTQVLSDGTNTYLYGMERIAEYSNANGWRYYLSDGLGSVRQVIDEDGDELLARSYEPYGETLSSAGSATSSYGFTGEWTESYIKLIYLRSRMYSPATGRFLTRDTWTGTKNQPISYNKWVYANANPVRFTDPTGQITADESYDAGQIVKKLLLTYNIIIEIDWSPLPIPVPTPPNMSNNYFDTNCGWNPGYWRSLSELNTVLEVADQYRTEMGSSDAVRQALGGVTIRRLPSGSTHTFRGAITIANYVFE